MPTAKLCVACLVLTSFLPAFVSEKFPPQASSERSTQEGLLLLHKMQDGLGGAKRIAAVQDFDETIRAEAWDARGAPLGEVRKRTRWMRSPSMLRLDQIGPRGTYVREGSPTVPVEKHRALPEGGGQRAGHSNEGYTPLFLQRPKAERTRLCARCVIFC